MIYITHTIGLISKENLKRKYKNLYERQKKKLAH